MSTYTNLCLYKLAYIASLEGAHSKNNKFWESQISKHGSEFFESKSAESLKTKWAKILKENSNDHKKVIKIYEKLISKEEKEEVHKHVEGQFEELEEEVEEIKVIKEPSKELSYITMQNLSKGSNGEYQKILKKSDEHTLKSSQDAITKINRMAKQYLCIKDLTSNTMCSKKRAMLDDGEDTEFEEIYSRLSAFAAQNPTNDDILDLLDKFSGNLNDVEKYIKGKTVSSWSNLEDMTLNQPASNEMYRFLLKTKGRAGVMKRKRYLQIN